MEDPLSGNIRYIGKGVNPKARYRDHVKIETPRTHKDFWILSLQKLGLQPKLIILETTTFVKGNEREIFWIAKYRSLGFNLTNHTDGGDGGRGSGYKLSDEHKRKLSEAATKRKPASEKARTNMSRAAKVSQIGNTNLLGHKHTEKSKEKMSKSQTGNKNATGKRSPEARLKMSKAKKEFWLRKAKENNDRSST